MFREHFKLMHFALNKELIEIYISIGLRSLAFSMISIFIPLYLLNELNYSFVDVILFFMVFYFFSLLFVPLSGKIADLIGFKKCMLLSSPFLIVYFLLLNFLNPNYNIFLLLIAGIGGISSSLFWIPFHVEFTRSSDKSYRGEEIGILYSFSLILGILGPLVGGVILTFFNFNLLFILVSILIITSTVVLLFSPDFRGGFEFSIEDVFSRKHLKQSIGLFGYAIEGLGIGIFWPIFIFFMLKGYLGLGFLSSFVGFVSAVFIFYVGFWRDKYGGISLIKIGSLINSISWFMRGFVKTVFDIFLITVIGSLSFVLMDVPFSALSYDRISKFSYNYIIFMEIFLNISRIILLGLIIILFNLLNNLEQTLFISFFLVGIGSLLIKYF